jgi:hypothetical protein
MWDAKRRYIGRFASHVREIALGAGSATRRVVLRTQVLPFVRQPLRRDFRMPVGALKCPFPASGQRIGQLPPARRAGGRRPRGVRAAPAGHGKRIARQLVAGARRCDARDPAWTAGRRQAATLGRRGPGAYDRRARNHLARASPVCGSAKPSGTSLLICRATVDLAAYDRDSLYFELGRLFDEAFSEDGGAPTPLGTSTRALARLLLGFWTRAGGRADGRSRCRYAACAEGDRIQGLIVGLAPPNHDRAVGLPVHPPHAARQLTRRARETPSAGAYPGEMVKLQLPVEITSTL